MKVDELGIMDLGTEPRATLGDQVPFFFYRYLSLFAVSDSKGAFAKAALFDGGYKVGTQLVKDMLYRDFPAFAQHYEQNGLGLVSLEDVDGEISKVRLKECATCSGLPPVDMTLCYFDGGILAGAMQTIAKASEPYRAREIECAGLGHASCLFEIGPSSQIEEV